MPQPNHTPIARKTTELFEFASAKYISDGHGEDSSPAEKARTDITTSDSRTKLELLKPMNYCDSIDWMSPEVLGELLNDRTKPH